MTDGGTLLGIIVLAILAIATIVVVVGGIVCVKDDTYQFAEYMSDLKGLSALLASAIIGALGRALLPILARNVNGT